MMTNTSERQEAVQKPKKHLKLKSLAYLPKVIISPVGAFREIVQNPNIVGFVFILALFLLAIAGRQYATASRIILETEPGQFISLLNSALFSNYLVSGVLQSFFNILISWFTYAGVFYLLAKLISKATGIKSSFLIVLGYAFLADVIYATINALLIPTFPSLSFQLSVWTSGAPGDISAISNTFNEVWGSLVVYQALSYLGLIFSLWLVTLGAIAKYVSNQSKFATAFLISGISYILSGFLTFLLLALLFAA